MITKSARGEIADNERRRHMDGWRQSARSKLQYCSQAGISVNQLNYWIKKARYGSANGGFVRATLTETSLQRPTMDHPLSAARLILQNGHVLEFTTDCNPMWAGHLVAAVGGRT